MKQSVQCMVLGIHNVTRNASLITVADLSCQGFHLLLSATVLAVCLCHKLRAHILQSFTLMFSIKELLSGQS